MRTPPMHAGAAPFDSAWIGERVIIRNMQRSWNIV